MAVSTWQSRLSAVNNRISSKLNDNAIRLAGIATDVIILRTIENKLHDPQAYEVSDIDVVNMIFPAVLEIPIWRFTGQGGVPDFSANDMASPHKEEPIKVFAPSSFKIDQGSLVLRFLDNAQAKSFNLPQGTEPWILPLQVKDVIGTFGARSMIWQQLNLSYVDQPLLPQVRTWMLEMANRRGLLQW